MVDLYPIALAVNLALLFLTLLYLKFAIQEVARQPSRPESAGNEEPLVEENGHEEESKVCGMISYLFSHYTLLGSCKKGLKGRMLVSLVMASVTNMSLYFGSPWWVGVLIGPVVSLGWLVGSAIAHTQQEYENGSVLRKGCYSILGMAGVAFQLYLCGTVYRYYINTHLQSYLINLLIATTVDQLAARPALMLLTALIAAKNSTLLDMQNQYKQFLRISSKYQGKVDLPRIEMLSKNNLIRHIEVEPEPIDLSKPQVHSPTSVINREDPSSPSQPDMLSRNSSNRSTQRRRTRPHQLNRLQNPPHELQQIDEIDPDMQLRNHHCLNLRKQRKEVQIDNNALRNKNVNYSAHQIQGEFVLEDFLCNSPVRTQNDPADKENVASRHASNGKSSKAAKTFRILERSAMREGEDSVLQGNKSELKSETDKSGMNKDSSFGFKTRKTDNTRASILKVRQQGRESGQLEQIAINTPSGPRRHSYNKSFAQNNPITEEEMVRRRKHRRRGTRCEQSQPYFADRNQRLIQLYLPGQRSELETSIRKSQTMNKSIQRSNGRGRDRPVFHQSQENMTQFFVPSF